MHNFFLMEVETAWYDLFDDVDWFFLIDWFFEFDHLSEIAFFAKFSDNFEFACLELLLDKDEQIGVFDFLKDGDLIIDEFFSDLARVELFVDDFDANGSVFFVFRLVDYWGKSLSYLRDGFVVDGRNIILHGFLLFGWNYIDRAILLAQNGVAISNNLYKTDDIGYSNTKQDHASDVLFGDEVVFESPELVDSGCDDDEQFEDRQGD